MIYPNIRDRRDDRREHYIAPVYDRRHFLGMRNLDHRWHSYHPKVNIHKDDHLYVMEVNLPGFEKEEIDISITGNLMKLKAEKKTVKEASQYILKEVDRDLVERTFVLDKNIAKEKVSASYRHGILTISFTDVPAEEESLKKTVTIE